jgi:hypothetical protein
MGENPMSQTNQTRPTPPHPEDYRPYNQMKAFTEGYAAYCKGDWRNPYGNDSADAQAWDRGFDYAMRLNRWNERAV